MASFVGKLHLDEGLDDGKQRLAKGGGVVGTQIRLLALVAVHVLEKGQTVRKARVAMVEELVGPDVDILVVADDARIDIAFQ